MDDRRLGLAIRELRRRLGWRQRDLAASALVSQSIVSRLERGRIELVSLAALRRVAGALDGRLVLELQWRGGLMDRLLDQRHAALVEQVATILRAAGWEVRAEVPFALFGERGSIDLLAWHTATRSLLAIEVKSELTSIEATLRQVGIRHRVAAAVARELGWEAGSVSVVLVLPESTTSRRRIAQHGTTFASVLPTPGSSVRGWLRAPKGRIAAAWLVSPLDGAARRQSPHRIRTRRAA